MNHHEVVIAGVDLSRDSSRVLSAAAEIAQRTHAREVHAVHVIPETESKDSAAAKVRLDLLQRPSGTFHFTREVRTGERAEELAESARSSHADLIVIAAHEHSAIRRAMVGGVSIELAQRAPCPVLVIPTADASPLRQLRNIVAAVDLSQRSRPVLEHAIAICEVPGGNVRLLSVFGPIGRPLGDDGVIFYSNEDEEAVARHHFSDLEVMIAETKHDGVRIVPEVAEAIRPADAILSVAEREQADLLVIGASHHSIWRRIFLGSTTSSVIAAANYPVLIVPGR